MMALALGLVGQPVQPYLTTGATDFVNSVQKGKEDAIKTAGLVQTNQKSALDILTAQKKQKDEQWYSDNAGALSRKVKTLDVADEDLARMAQVNPEYHKVLQSEKADAVKNFNASNLAYLGSSTDKAKAAQDIIHAHEAHGMTIPDQFKQSPELLMQYLKVINAGSKAFDLKNVSKNESGDIITTDITGNTTDITPNTNKPKPTPVIRNGKRVTQPIKLPNGRTRTEQLMSDGTWQELDTSAPPAPKSTGSKVYETLDKDGHVQFELVKDNQLPTGKPKGDGVGKIEASRIEMINNAANDAIISLSQIQSLPIAAQVLPLFNSADAKKGVFSENMRKYLANKVSEESAQIYRSIVSGLALDAAKVKAGGMFVNQKVIDEITKGIVVQAGETEGTAMFKLAEAARRLYSSLATMTRGTPEQIEVRDALADYLKENFPDPNLILSAQTGIKYTPTPDVLHSIREKRKGGNEPDKNTSQPTQTPQGKQPQTIREWYLYRWNNAKTPEARKKLTDEYIKMGSPK
jgi:hypothetical protein